MCVCVIGAKLTGRTKIKMKMTKTMCTVIPHRSLIVA